MQMSPPRLLGALLPVLAALLLASPTIAVATDTSTAFTYQGHLRSDDTPAHGAYDFQFALFDSGESGEPITDPITLTTVPVDHGRFTVALDFGFEPVAHSQLWLEIGIRPHLDPTDFIPLTPRQPMLPVPQALHARHATQATQADFATQASVADLATQATQATQADLALELPAGTVTAAHLAESTLTADRIAPGQVVTGLNDLRDAVVLAAGPNLALAIDGQTLTFSSPANWRLDGNANTNPELHFLGTTDARAFELRVNNARALRLEPGSHPGVVNVLGGSRDNYIRPGISGATIAGGGAVYGIGDEPTNSVHAQFGSIVGGYGHLIGTNAAFSSIGGGRSNTVHFFAYDATIGGGHRNTVSEDSFASVIAGGRQNSIAELGRDSTIGGGSENRIGRNAFVSTIAGGETNSIGPNSHAATMSGGARNAILAGSRFATISGGGDNFIHDNSFSSVIGGGGDNHVRSSSERSTIAGGKWNQIGSLSPHAAIGGGFTNVIGPNAHAATIPGGDANRADGRYAFAAGQRAHALHPGAFVWADSTKFNFPSTATNEFSVRALGGVRFVSAVDFEGTPASGVALEPGAGSWSSLSDRNAKENFDDVDPRVILDQLIDLPILSWNYKTQSAHVRHLGPIAQDFQAAFQLGADPRRITTVDAHGVALAAIQGLHQVVADKESRIQSLERQNRELEQRLNSLESILRNQSPQRE
jgi:trimeric autotransporter adhesin